MIFDKSKKIVAAAYVVLALSMAVATFVEWRMGTAFAHEWFYGALWFAVVLGVGALAMLVIVVTALRKRKAALLLHLALVVILVGALCTRLFGQQGTVHLRLDGPVSSVFVTEQGEMRTMPFSIGLREFAVECYPATDTPLDYRSVIEVDGAELTVSMNRVASVRGYRFFQSGYDPDERGTYLSVIYDPAGRASSYAGYALLVLGFVLVLVDRKGRFAALLRSLSTPAAGLVAIVLASCSEPSRAPEVPRELAHTVTDSAVVLYNGRIVPLTTYATDFTLKLTGRRDYAGQSAEQVFVGWMCFPDLWQGEPLIRVKDELPDDLTPLVRDKHVAIADLFDHEGRYLLLPHLRSQSTKAVRELNDRVQLIVMLTSGDDLLLFPFRTPDNSLRWYAPTDSLPATVSPAEQRFARQFVPMLRSALASNDTALVQLLASKLHALQQRNLGPDMPATWRLRLETAVEHTSPATWLFRLTLTIALLMLVIFIVSRGTLSTALRRTFIALTIALTAAQAVALICRALIAQQLPLATGYETMLFLAFALALIACFAWRMAFILLPIGTLLSGFALLVADIGMNNPSITPLMPVLHSPWLSSHVATIMMAYALLTLTAVNSLASLLRRTPSQRSAQISLALLYPAVALLATGIFIGAVWANESWGSYWSWDPKEVWALITLLVYAVPLHPMLVPALSRPRTLHIYLALAFLTVLMTYFGVNHLLGGMHSYGSN